MCVGSDSDFEADIARFAQQAGGARGAYSLLLVDGLAAAKLFTVMERGDSIAANYIGVLQKFLRGIEHASRKTAPLCMTCERVLVRRARPPVLGILLPLCDVPENAIAMGFCRHCTRHAKWPLAGWQKRLAELAAPRFGEIWDNWRLLDPVHFPPGIGADLVPVGTA